MFELSYLPPGQTEDGQLKTLVFTDAFWHFLAARGTPEPLRHLFETVQFMEWEPLGRALLLKDSGEPMGNYFAIRRGEDVGVSYMPTGKPQAYNADGDFKREGRQTMKPGRWVRSLFSSTLLENFGISDNVLEEFTKEVKAFCDTSITIKEVTGAEIGYWYNEKRYAAMRGTLGSSCMRSKDSSIFDWYVKNPDCSMVIALTADNKLQGRALLWRNVIAHAKGSSYDYSSLEAYRPIGSITLMDRIYDTDDYVQAALKAYAKEKGYYYKQTQSYEAKTKIVHPHTDAVIDSRLYIRTNMTVPKAGLRPEAPVKYFPYCDTFTYISADFAVANNVSGSGNGPYSATSTGGQLAGYKPSPVATGEYVLTDLDGMIPQRYVFTCALSKMTGHVNKGIRVPGVEGRVHTLAAALYLRQCAISGNYHRKEDMEPYYETPTDLLNSSDVTKTGRFIYKNVPHKEEYMVKSKHHGCMIGKSGAVHLPAYSDYVFPTISPVIKSTMHSSLILVKDAVWWEEKKDFVCPRLLTEENRAKLDAELAERAAKEGQPAPKPLAEQLEDEARSKRVEAARRAAQTRRRNRAAVSSTMPADDDLSVVLTDIANINIDWTNVAAAAPNPLPFANGSEPTGAPMVCGNGTIYASDQAELMTRDDARNSDEYHQYVYYRLVMVPRWHPEIDGGVGFAFEYSRRKFTVNFSNSIYELQPDHIGALNIGHGGAVHFIHRRALQTTVEYDFANPVEFAEFLYSASDTTLLVRRGSTHDVLALAGAGGEG